MINAGGLALPEKVGRSREEGPLGDCLVVIDRQGSKDSQAEGKHGGLGSGRHRGQAVTRLQRLAGVRSRRHFALGHGQLPSASFMLKLSSCSHSQFLGPGGPAWRGGIITHPEHTCSLGGDVFCFVFVLIEM